MRIHVTRQRHEGPLRKIMQLCTRRQMAGNKYIVLIIDGPESVNREASWASSFNPEDTHKIIQQLAIQTRDA